MFWVMLLIYAATTVLSGLLQRAPKVKASSLGELQAPTAEEGRNLPVIFGTCIMKAPNVVWYGDLKTTEIKKSGGLFGLQKYTIGHRYHLGMDLALCHGPVDELVDILAGSGGDLKSLSWEGGKNILSSSPYRWISGMTLLSPSPTTNADGSLRLYIASHDAFGGDEKEGGVSGWGTFYCGSNTQGSDSYMSSKLGITYPAYRGVCHFVADQMYVGTSPYIKNLAFVLRRCPNNLSLAANQYNLGGDANPAEIIYECLRNPEWGLGIPSARIDLNAFRDAGVTLASESMGISLQIDSQQKADDVISTVLQHIDGVCYTDPATGLWTLKLVRAVDPGTLPEFGPADIIEAEFTRGSWDQTVNEIKIRYTDRSTWKDAMVSAVETANFAARGEKDPLIVDFPGFSNASLAMRVATREIRTHSQPVGRGRVRVNRKAWQWRMGTGFLFTWPALGISRMPVRVTSIDYGSLENGAIEAEIVEDIFNVNYTAYTPPGSSGWVNPIGPPAPIQHQLIQEAPYQISGEERRILCAAARASGLSDYYEVWSDEGEGWYRTNTVDYYCPSGVLVTPYSRMTDAVDRSGILVSGVDLHDLVNVDEAGLARGDNLLVIVGEQGEWCGWQEITDVGDGTYQISGIVRGVFDTTPRDHAAGARVYIVANYSTLHAAITREASYASDQVVQVRLLPHNSDGVVDLEAVTSVYVNLASRAWRPYPPGNLRVNGVTWPDGAGFGEDDVTVTWAHRNRTAQSGRAIVAQDEPSVAAGPEGSYTCEVLIDGSVKHARTQTGITGTSFTYTHAERVADDPDLQKPVQVRITPVNGSLTGTPRLTDPFYMTTVPPTADPPSYDDPDPGDPPPDIPPTPPETYPPEVTLPWRLTLGTTPAENVALIHYYQLNFLTHMWGTPPPGGVAWSETGLAGYVQSRIQMPPDLHSLIDSDGVMICLRQWVRSAHGVGRLTGTVDFYDESAGIQGHISRWRWGPLYGACAFTADERWWRESIIAPVPPGTRDVVLQYYLEPVSPPRIPIEDRYYKVQIAEPECIFLAAPVQLQTIILWVDGPDVSGAPDLWRAVNGHPKLHYDPSCKLSLYSYRPSYYKGVLLSVGRAWGNYIPQEYIDSNKYVKSNVPLGASVSFPVWSTGPADDTHCAMAREVELPADVQSLIDAHHVCARLGWKSVSFLAGSYEDFVIEAIDAEGEVLGHKESRWIYRGSLRMGMYYDQVDYTKQFWTRDVIPFLDGAIDYILPAGTRRIRVTVEGDYIRLKEISLSLKDVLVSGE